MNNIFLNRIYPVEFITFILVVILNNTTSYHILDTTYLSNINVCNINLTQDKFSSSELVTVLENSNLPLDVYKLSVKICRQVSNFMINSYIICLPNKEMAPHVAQTIRQSPTEPVCCSAIVGDTKMPDPRTIISDVNLSVVEDRSSYFM